MSPSPSSKPYQVHELLPVWGGITEDDGLVRILSHCHGNNSCNQSARSGCRSLAGMLLPVNVVAGLTARRTLPPKHCASARTEEKTRDMGRNRVDPSSAFSVPPWAPSLPPVHPHLPTPPQTCAFCECYSVKPSSVERFFCPMLVIHVCKKPRPLTWPPQRYFN